MGLTGKLVKIINGKFIGIEGTVKGGVTLDGYLCVVPKNGGQMLVKENEVKIIDK